MKAYNWNVNSELKQSAPFPPGPLLKPPSLYRKHDALGGLNGLQIKLHNPSIYLQ
jgi:hypothetical protein